MSNRRRRIAYAVLSVVTNALFVMGMPLLAMVMLEPAEFGTFSVLQLAYALLSSAMLSVIAEPWARRKHTLSSAFGWSEYSSVLGILTLLAAIAGVIISALLPPLLPFMALAGLGLAASTYRAGTRYFQQYSGNWPMVIIADLAGLTVAIAVVTITLSLGVEVMLSHIMLAWTSAFTASALVTRAPAWPSARVLLEWIRSHSSDIRVLVRDSVITDAGGVGGQLATAPFLGLTDFGTFRAASNVASPMRMLVAPLRATLARVSHSRVSSSGVMLVASGLAGIVAACVWVVLAFIRGAGWDLGALSALAPFGLPVGIFVGATLLLHLYSIVARAHSGGRALLVGRAVQSAMVLAFVPVAAILFGLKGAIWAYAIATTISASSWLIIAKRTRG